VVEVGYLADVLDVEGVEGVVCEEGLVELADYTLYYFASSHFVV